MEAYCSVQIENCDDLKVKAVSVELRENVCVCVSVCDFISGLRQERDQLTRFLPQ